MFASNCTQEARLGRSFMHDAYLLFYIHSLSCKYSERDLNDTAKLDNAFCGAHLIHIVIIVIITKSVTFLQILYAIRYKMGI
jgi:hypothetical protein